MRMLAWPSAAVRPVANPRLASTRLAAATSRLTSSRSEIISRGSFRANLTDIRFRLNQRRAIFSRRQARRRSGSAALGAPAVLPGVAFVGGFPAPESLAHVVGIELQVLADALERKKRAVVAVEDPRFGVLEQLPAAFVGCQGVFQDRQHQPFLAVAGDFSEQLLQNAAVGGFDESQCRVHAESPARFFSIRC